MELVYINGIIQGVLGSLVASVIWAIIVLFFSRRILKIIRELFHTLFDSGAKNIYQSSRDPEYSIDIKRDLEKARKIRICCSRGNFLEKQPFRSVLNNSQAPIEILLSQHTPNPWLALRLDEVNKFEEIYTESTICDSIKTNMRYLNKCKGPIKIKNFSSIHIGRIILTDEVAYFSPYLKESFGEDIVIYKYMVNSSMYCWLERIFDEMWNVK